MYTGVKCDRFHCISFNNVIVTIKALMGIDLLLITVARKNEPAVAQALFFLGPPGLISSIHLISGRQTIPVRL